MKSLEDYVNVFRGIAEKKNLQGDSVEVLVQMLAHAAYISEVEHIKITKEASCESSCEINSKIQAGMDSMYSIFRGSCPRMILSFRSEPDSSKTLKMYERILSPNSYSAFFHGYWDGKSWVHDSLKLEGGKEYIIELILTRQVYNKTWIFSGNDSDIGPGILYLDCDPNMKNIASEVSLEYGSVRDVEDNTSPLNTTTNFSDHILGDKIVFDLTTTDFSSRLYLPEKLRDSNYKFTAKFFALTSLGDYVESDLKKAKYGEKNISFTTEFLETNGYDPESEIAAGVLVLDKIDRPKLDEIHYQICKNRYTSSVVRSNSDIGELLEKVYPGKVRPGGTTYRFNNNSICIYYVPQDTSGIKDSELTEDEIEDYINNRGEYYITKDINIKLGVRIRASLEINLLVTSNRDLSSDIMEVISKYCNKFNTGLKNSLGEIEAGISKISEVKEVKVVISSYVDDSGSKLDDESGIDLGITYFTVDKGNIKINSSLC